MDSIKRAVFGTIVMLIAMCVYAQYADAMTLAYNVANYDKPTVHHLYNLGCYAKASDKAERMYCPVKYRLFIYDDETGAYDFLYYTDEGKVRHAAATALIKGWDVAEWEDV